MFHFKSGSSFHHLFLAGRGLLCKHLLTPCKHHALKNAKYFKDKHAILKILQYREFQ